MTSAQRNRQQSRAKTGRYKQHIRCELCGLNVGENYCSDARCNSMGMGVTLHEKCGVVLALLPENAASAVLLVASTTPSPRHLTKILDAERKVRTGCVSLHFCRRGTGPLTGVYRSAEAGMETDHEYPWSVVCEAHHTLVSTETRAAADSTATDTRNFCDDCRDTAPTDLAKAQI
jgi:hypothetical protein